jgi:hypothetical protein
MKKFISFLFISFIDFLKRFDRISTFDPTMEELIGGITRRAAAIALKEGKQ